MTREQGIEMVLKYDHVRPYDMDLFLKNTGMTEQQVFDLIEPMRDPSIWEKTSDGNWLPKDNIGNHANDPGVDSARLPAVGNWRPFEPTPTKTSPREQEDGRQEEYVTI